MTPNDIDYIATLGRQDILPRVFEQPSPGWREYSFEVSGLDLENSSALARAARTCHAFSGPALDVLWRALDDLHALLKLFPSYMEEEDLSVWVSSPPSFQFSSAYFG